MFLPLLSLKNLSPADVKSSFASHNDPTNSIISGITTPFYLGKFDTNCTSVQNSIQYQCIRSFLNPSFSFKEQL